jgi:uncharacterized DUF497 family protein
MLFDWSDAKAESNEAKHRVTSSYARQVFLDPDHVDFDVSRPQDGEERRKAVGSIGGKLYSVVYTRRGDTRWMISARRTNRMENRLYDKVQT